MRRARLFGCHRRSCGAVVATGGRRNHLACASSTMPLCVMAEWIVRTSTKFTSGATFPIVGFRAAVGLLNNGTVGHVPSFINALFCVPRRHASMRPARLLGFGRCCRGKINAVGGGWGYFAGAACDTLRVIAFRIVRAATKLVSGGTFKLIKDVCAAIVRRINSAASEVTSLIDAGTRNVAWRCPASGSCYDQRYCRGRK
jgi:hypothetical protein